MNGYISNVMISYITDFDNGLDYMYNVITEHNLQLPVQLKMNDTVFPANFGFLNLHKIFK